MKVSFGMLWQTYGRQTLEVPEMPYENVSEYLKEHWDEIPLPEGDYIGGSDELDEESIEIDRSEL